MIGTLLFPLTAIFVFGVQVDNVCYEGTGIESGGIFHPLSALAIDVGKEIPRSLAQLVEDECEEPLIVVIDPSFRMESISFHISCIFVR